MADRIHPLVLSNSRVRLREFRDGDTEAVLGILGDARVTAWLSFDVRSQSEVETMLRGTIERAKAEQRQEFYLAVEFEDKLIGFVRLALSGVCAAKLGYAIAADSWGHGFASQAVELMLGFGFEQLGLHRVTAAIGPNNAASVRVVSKLGFTYEGCLRDHVFTNGTWRDSELYSLLAHEWNP